MSSQPLEWVVYCTEYRPCVDGVDRPYLKGPVPPKEVLKKGYSVTAKQSEAWRFPTSKQAKNKARIINKHMGWESQGLHKMSVSPVAAVEKEGVKQP